MLSTSATGATKPEAVGGASSCEVAPAGEPVTAEHTTTGKAARECAATEDLAREDAPHDGCWLRWETSCHRALANLVAVTANLVVATGNSSE
jgi:hypothetical protein